MKAFILFIALMPAMSFASASKKTYLATQAQQASKSVRIPAEVVKELESFYVSEFRRQDSAQAAIWNDIEVLMRLKRKALRTKVRFEPIDSPVLAGNLRFDMPLGGGEILLNKHVRSQYPGRFKVFFDVEPLTKDSAVRSAFKNTVKVLYISQGKRRKVKGRNLGSGCGQYFDMTESFKETISSKGLTVDVMDASHVSALGGLFLFAFVHEEHLNLAVVKFSDTQYSQFLCS